MSSLGSGALIVDDAASAIDFYKEVFGAKERALPRCQDEPSPSDRSVLRQM